MNIKKVILLNFILFCFVYPVYAGWGTVVIDSGTRMGMYTSIAIDSNDNIHISYQDNYKYDLKYIIWDGNDWNAATIDSEGNVGSCTSIVLDKNDYPHISYYDNSNYLLKYAKWDGIKWSTSSIVSAGFYGKFTNIVLDSNDNPHIIYHDYHSNTVRHAYWFNNSWSTTTIDTVDSFINSVALGIDSSDNLHIAYKGSGTNIFRYAKWNKISWNISTIDSHGHTGRGFYGSSSIDIDSNDSPHITYYFDLPDLHTTGLKYAKLVNSSWEITTVDGWIGAYHSLNIDENDVPNIVCTGSLNYFHHLKLNNGSWLRTKIDTQRYVGQYCDAAIDSDGVIHASYYGGSNYGLKLAKITNNPSLSWIGEENYITDGLNPESGNSLTKITFRIKYRDPDNDPPLLNSPKVIIQEDEAILKEISMNYVSGDYNAGAIYSTSTYFNSFRSSMNYVFSAYDIWGASATVFLKGYGPEINGFIKGYIKDETGDPVSGVSVALLGYESKTCLTDSAGYYEFLDLKAGEDYLIIPSKGNSSFNPIRRTYETLGEMQINQNYTLLSGNNYSWINTYWSTHTVDTGSVGDFSSIAYDSKNNIHIAYYDAGNKKVKYAKLENGSWDIQTVDSGGWYGISIAIDSNDMPHIAYSDETNKDLRYAVLNGSMWTTNTVDATGDVGYCCKMLINSNNYPVIAYLDNSNHYLKYAEWTGSSWDIQTVDSDNADGWLSIAFDSNNNPHISYYNMENQDLKYAYKSASSWYTVVVDTINNVGEFSSIAIDENDKVHIAYSYFPSNSVPSYPSSYSKFNLKYAVREDGNWAKDIIDSDGNIGAGICIKLDSNKNPHISYFDWANAKIKYLGYTGISWISSIVDTSINVGNIHSMIIDINNTPHISYYNSSNKTLKYCTWRKNPTLMFTGESNFESRAVNMETGYESTIFSYRVKYLDSDNDPPGNGYPKLYILKGNSNISGSPFTMQEVDPTDRQYNNGKIYNYSTTLPGGSYTYYISAYDLYNFKASGSPCDIQNGPNVTGLNTPVSGQVKVVGSSKYRGIINPDEGDTAKIYFQGSNLGDYTCKIFSMTGEILYEITKSNVNNGYFEWIPNDIASGVYIAYVKGPGIDIKKKVAILR